MNETYTIEHWEELILNSELSQSEKADKMHYVKNAFENNVPVILDIKHLSVLLGLKVGVLNNMINKPISFYRQFKIPKRSGGMRDIVTPYKSLLEAQRWITTNIFNKFEIHDAAYAYQKGRNVVQNSALHIGNEEMLKIDLKDFFPSVSAPRVRELFSRIGYSKEIAYYLTNLCCLNNSIPQGAATSPIISNIILFNLDKRLSNLCSNNEIKYSRYADDLIFSCYGSVFHLSFSIHSIIVDEGFKINHAKTREYTGMHRKMVTGIVVGNSQISLPKVKKREIKQNIHYIIKYGILEQVKRYNDIYYAERILGRLGYWKQIEPQNEYVISSIKAIKVMYKDLLRDLANK